MIETPRLLIKPLSREELIMQLESPGLLARDLGLSLPESPLNAETKEAILNDLLPGLSDPQKDPLFYTMWIIIHKEKMAVIGGICFHGEPDQEGLVEIGYGTDENYRNMGYMAEALSGLVQWVTGIKKVKTIGAVTVKDNLSSIRVLEKNGFELTFQDDQSVIMRLKIRE